MNVHNTPTLLISDLAEFMFLLYLLFHLKERNIFIEDGHNEAVYIDFPEEKDVLLKVLIDYLVKNDINSTKLLILVGVNPEDLYADFDIDTQLFVMEERRYRENKRKEK